MNVRVMPSQLLAGLLSVTLLLTACISVDRPEVVIDPAAAEGAVADPTARRTGVGEASNVLMTATSLSGYDFQSRDDAVSGEIQDVILDLATGDILYVTVEYGGFLDIGDTELPMPLSAFIWGPNNELVLNFDEALLNDFPDLGTEWPDFTTPNWDDEVVTFWRGIGLDAGIEFTEVTDTVVRAADIWGLGVGDVGLGASNVSDLLIDLGRSRVAYVLIAYDPGLFNDDLVAVPFSAFAVTSLGDELNLDSRISAVILESAPRFNQDVFTTGEPQLFIDINDYWGAMGFGAELGRHSQAVPTAQADTPSAVAGMGIAGTERVLVRASALLDYDVRNPAGDGIGEIQDLLLDAETGRVLFATLEYGGFLDIGDNEVPVPLSALAWNGENELTLNVDEEQLDTLPDVGTEWPDVTDVTWNDEVTAFWRELGIDPGFGATDVQQVIYVSELIDEDLGDIGLNAEGSIHDLLLNLSQGQAPWAIVDYGGLFDNDLVPIPFSALQTSSGGDDDQFILNVEPAFLQTAPRMGRDGFENSSLFDIGFDDELMTYWEDGGYRVNTAP